MPYIDPNSGAAPQPGGQVGGRPVEGQPTPEEYAQTQYLQNPEKTEEALSTPEDTGSTEEASDTENPDAEANEAEKAGAEEEDLDQYATGGGWYEINGEKVQGKDAARKALKG